ncbi:MAG: hypothetical protein MN733_08195 [Nitrososphaera sp.]|nr:hypothetical protein [Nitrososphaera sp.]
MFKDDERYNEVVKTIITNYLQEDFHEVIEKLRYAPITKLADIVAALDKVIPFDAEVERKLSQGDLKGAEEIAKSQFDTSPNDPKRVQAYVGVLLAYNIIEKANVAFGVLKNCHTENIELYVKLAVTFHQNGDIRMAIEVSKKGMEVADRLNIRDHVYRRLRSNLAYFYADAGDKFNELDARNISEEEYNADPNNPARMDTYGYVKIVYENSKGGVKEGMDLCHKAYTMAPNAPIEFYKKHLARGIERLQRENLID